MSETKVITSPVDAAVEKWHDETLDPTLKKHPEIKQRF